MKSNLLLIISVLFTFSASANQGRAVTHRKLSPAAVAARANLPKRPIFCEFWTGNQLFTLPNAFMIYDPKTSTLYTRTGVPWVTRQYSKIVVQTGAAPYGNGGYNLVAFGDVPALSVRFKKNDTAPILAYALDNMEATWRGLPGFPSTLDNGLCFNHPWFQEDFQGW